MPDWELALIGDFKKALDEERKDIGVAVYDAADDFAALLKKRFRLQVTNAGLGNRLAKTWRHNTYPRRGTFTLEPVAVVYSKAPHIVSAFSSDQPIRSKSDAGFLAIPTDFAPSSRKPGARGRRMAMDDFLDVFGNDSLKVFAKPGSGGRVFYAVAEKGFRKSKGKRGGSRQIREGSRSKAETVLMYVLVKQVRLAKRFDIRAVQKGAQRAYPEVVNRKIAERLGR